MATSFAAVDVTPAIDDETVIEVDFANDVREDTYRAGGAGGQHVNKTSSAIRLTHLPTNVVVQCQNERSQHKNRALARKMLIAKLYQRDREKKAAETAARRGQKSKIGFGGETIRNYVLHPDQFVKDTLHRPKVGQPDQRSQRRTRPVHLRISPLVDLEGLTGGDREDQRLLNRR